jgi:hypothetical protein
MDPMDALVVKAVREAGGTSWEPNRRAWVASKLNCSTDEVIVSFAHLNRLDCISADVGGPAAKVEPTMRPFGTLLMNVVSD